MSIAASFSSPYRIDVLDVVLRVGFVERPDGLIVVRNIVLINTLRLIDLGMLYVLNMDHLRIAYRAIVAS